MLMLLRKTPHVLIVIFALGFMSGCDYYKDGSERLTYKEKLLVAYAEQGRDEVFFELEERYDSRLVLFLNREEDRAWVINFSAWLVTLIIDIPAIGAMGTVYGIFLVVAWFLGVTLTGGGILAVLAWLGTLMGGLPGIPPAIAGILYLGIICLVCYNLISYLLAAI